ncbi:hypothetical protein CASFOL_002061 [Castilleja foliolosa]|uniref:Cytochrome b5 heme-binding domain-containing protein n=1 Tax=Castilleja foliolosa TaxID=1961234 RepID=A0ABD3ED67_9LAMI
MAIEVMREILYESNAAHRFISPTTFLTVVAVGFTLYYVVSNLLGPSEDGHQQRSRNSTYQEIEPLRPPVQLGEITAEELRQYDGSDPQKPLLVAIKGRIYDVTNSRAFYGPGGPYAVYAGKDASRALAKMTFEEKDVNDDLTGLDVAELEALQDWENKFMTRYVKVGTVKMIGPTGK